MSAPTFHQQVTELYRKAVAHGTSIEELDTLFEAHLHRLQATLKTEQTQELDRADRVKKQTPLAVRAGAVMVPLVFVAVGIYLIGSAVIPILGYTQESSSIAKSELVSPIIATEVLEVTPLTEGAVAGASTKKQGVTIINESLDYTNLNNWFGSAPVPAALANAQDQEQRAATYTLDIPSINIANAQVEVGGADLNKNLIAYAGTAYPGELGAPVIFGHSVLRQFYNPSEKNPRRYNSIFSTIMTLSVGDPIYVTHEGVKYTYIVQDKTEVQPEDVHILKQSYDAKRLKLVTCTPEGTYLRRGVVTAELVEGA